MVTYILNFVKNGKVVISNFGYLTMITVLNLIAPIVLYPYLIKILGLELYGKIIFAQVLVSYFSFFINFGLNISAPKEIAIHRENKSKLIEIISANMSITIVLWLISFTIWTLLISNITVLNRDKYLYFLSFGITISDVFFLSWYYQGIERMKNITLINFITKLMYIGLTLLFVKTKDDYLFVPLFFSLSFILSSIVSLYIIFIKHNNTFRLQNKIVLKNHIKNALPVFYFSLFGMIKSRSNELFLGLITSYSSVTVYNLSSKITSITTSVISNITNAVYPKISITKDTSSARKVIILISVISIIAYLIIALSSNMILQLLGGDALVSYRWVLFLVLANMPIYTISTALGQLLLLPHGFKKQFSIGTITSTIVYLLLSIYLVISNFLSLLNVAIVLLVSNTIALSVRYYYSKKEILI